MYTNNLYETFEDACDAVELDMECIDGYDKSDFEKNKPN